jgi:hypothetical protein
MNAEQLNRLARQFWTVDEIGFHVFSLYLLKNRISSTSMLDYSDEFPVNWSSFRWRTGREWAWMQLRPGHYHTHRV